MQSPPTNRRPRGQASAAGHSAAQQYARQSCTAGRRKAFLVLTGCRKDGHSARVFSCPAEGPAGIARRRQARGKGPCTRGADHGRRPGSLLARWASEKLGKDDMKTPSHITSCAASDRPIALFEPIRFGSEIVAAERNTSIGPPPPDATRAGPTTCRAKGSPGGSAGKPRFPVRNHPAGVGEGLARVGTSARAMDPRWHCRSQ